MINLTNDKLNRTQFLNGLFSLFNNFGNQGNRGFTMIINGKFGSGKSTLLGFIEEKNNEKNEFNIVKYNAWANNLFSSPLIPILYEISKLESNKGKIKEGAKNILKKIPKIFLSTLAGAHAVDFTPLLENENIFDEYDNYKEALDKFRTILTDYCKNKKVLFLIDELDRCLPEYQIKVLEAIYHLLEIPNLIVVIALDKEQLECSIKSKFGDNKNTLGYLSKFINYQIDLPDNEDINLVKSLMTFKSEEENSVKEFIAALLKLMDYSVRDCQTIISEINLICNEIDDDGNKKNFYFWYPILVAFIIIVKTENEKIYKEYFTKINNNFIDNKKISLKSSNYNRFLENIKGTKIEKLMNYLIGSNDNVLNNTFLMLYIINMFCSVKTIESKDLANHLNMSEENLDKLLAFSFGRVSYPNTVNNLIRKINELKF